jgi:G patch domain-containing protein 1
MRSSSNNTVRDEQGRQRFHGAFTGGFSAGYYNTVGSEEGFQPKTFISSRKQKAQQKQQSVRDFMDEEDGLLGGSLVAKKELDSFLPDNQKPSASLLIDDDDLRNDEQSRAVKLLLSNLVVEPSNTMGKKILALMGWKPGMAIGPRIKKKEYQNTHIPSSSLPVSVKESSALTFAPREDKSFMDLYPIPKIDYRGIGFEGNDDLMSSFKDYDNAETNQYRISDLFSKKDSTINNNSKKVRFPDSSSMKNQSSAKRKLSSYLEEEDDIAYDNDTNAYSTVIEDDYEEKDSYLKGQRQKESNIDKYLEGVSKTSSLIPCPSDGRLPIPGFHVAKAAQMIPPYYPAPEVPPNFIPFHSFRSSALTSEKEKESFSLIDTSSRKSNFLENANKRKELLSEEVEKSPSLENGEEAVSSEKKSVFDFLKPADRNRILGLAKKLNPSAPIVQEEAIPFVPQIPEASLAERERQQQLSGTQQKTDQRPLLVSSSVLNSAFAGLSESFKNRFTSSSSSSTQVPKDEKGKLAEVNTDKDVASGSDVIKEGLASLNEYSNLRKLKEGDNNTFPVNAEATKKELMSTIKKSQMQRVTSLWSPHPLLCKRNRIQVPQVGVQPQATLQPPPEESSNKLDPLFSRLFNGNEVKNEEVQEKQKELLRKLAKDNQEGLEKEKKKSEELTKEFEQLDVYQSSVPKPSLSVFKSIFADSERDDDDNDVEEATGRNASDTVVSPFSSVIRGPINQTSETKITSTDTSTSTTQEISKLPSFVPKSKRISQQPVSSVVSKPGSVENRHAKTLTFSSSSSKSVLKPSSDFQDVDDEEMESLMVRVPPPKPVSKKSFEIGELESTRSVETVSAVIQSVSANDDQDNGDISFKKRRINRDNVKKASRMTFDPNSEDQ